MNASLSLLAIATHIPPLHADLAALPFGAAVSPVQWRIYRKYYGIERVAWTDATVVAMHDASLTQLTAHPAYDAGRVRAVWYARTVPTTAPWGRDVYAPLRRHVPHAAWCGIAMAHCASGLQALDAAARWLADDPDGQIVLLAGEKSFASSVWITPQALMGESTVAVLLGYGTRHRLLATASYHAGQYSVEPYRREVMLDREYNRSYTRTLRMVVEQAVARAGYTMDAMTRVIPQNVNRIALRALAAHYGRAPAWVFTETLAQYGHAFCADPFLNYRAACGAGAALPGQPVVLCAAGAGGSFAATVVLP